MQNLSTRIEYIQAQVSGAANSVRVIAKGMAEGSEKQILTEALERLHKVRRVMNGAEAPTDKRGRLDYESAVSEPE